MDSINEQIDVLRQSITRENKSQEFEQTHLGPYTVDDFMYRLWVLGWNAYRFQSLEDIELKVVNRFEVAVWDAELREMFE